MYIGVGRLVSPNISIICFVMKKLNLISFFAAAILLGSVDALAETNANTYCFKPCVRSANPSMGLVYINKSDVTPTTYYASGSSVGSAESSMKKTYSDRVYVYAKPARGYKFKEWTYENGSAGTGTGTISFQSKTSAKTRATMYATAGTTYQNLWYATSVANFVADEQTYTINLNKPDAGSITAKTTIYSISSNTFTTSTETKSVGTSDPSGSIQVAYYEADDITLSATNGEDGSNFFAWYIVEGSTKTEISKANPYTLEAKYKNKDITICAEFSISNYLVGETGYETISEAISAAQSGTDKTIVLLQDVTWENDVTIPSGVTLLIPNNAYHKLYTDFPETGQMYRAIPEDESTAEHQYEDRSFVYKKLTLASNVTVTVEGAISLGGWRWCPRYYATYGLYTPDLSGNCRLDQGYGLIDMAANSTIVLVNGSNLYCWGRIRGEGTITVKKGAKVRESWVFTDSRENDAYACMYYDDNYNVFPMSQYYVQDIQVPITFYYGAVENLVTSMVVDDTTSPFNGTISWIDSIGSFFKLQPGGSITKRYDVATDRLIYNLKAVNIESAKLKVPAVGTLSAATVLFNITNNNTINVDSGTTTIKYDLALAAGAELNIAEGAEVVVGAYASMYVFDSDDWDRFACKRKIIPLFLPSYELQVAKAYESVSTTFSGYQTTYKAIRTEDNMTDAKIKVNGTLTIKGMSNRLFDSKSGLYTTAGGAKIYSDNAGKIIYEQGAGEQTYINQLWRAGRESQNDCAKQDTSITITPAKLMNVDGKFLSTEAYVDGTMFEYVNGNWCVKRLIKKIVIEENHTTIVAKDEQGKDTIIEKSTSSYIIPAGSVVEASDTIFISEASSLIIEENASVDANTVVLRATPNYLDVENNEAGRSSQIISNGLITAENAYIDITMDPSGQLDDKKYYSFAVPFKVAIQAGAEGVEMLNENGEVQPAQLEANYRAYSYDGAARAANGANGSAWKIVTAASDGGYFLPGKFYLVEFANSQCNVFRFHKAAGEALNNVADLELIANSSQTGDVSDAGWNGIANTALQTAQITVSDGVAQVYDPIEKRFFTIELDETSFAMGANMMIQVQSNTIATNSATPVSNPVAERLLATQVKEQTDDRYVVCIADKDAAKIADQMFISASEDAETDYIIGKDLVKMFFGNASVAQLWVSDYGKKLSMNHAVLTNDVAEVSVTFYAPKAGNYQVYLRNIPDNATIYLLENNEVIANLNEGVCNLALSKGENMQYGIRINTKKIPGVSTSIDEALESGKALQKVLINDVVYIIHDGQAFNVLGQKANTMIKK